ncbi:MAG: hypothetical protein HIU83_11055 [Proteobacteria bacterium]|nr:hypothetical protein [Pseudomonadota bacterium]
MPQSHKHQAVNDRQSIYRFGDYNPYLPSGEERELVQENLTRLHLGKITLEIFLKQTPQFPRWLDGHIRQARILLISNEPGLIDVEKLYYGLKSATTAEETAWYFKQAMCSWLGLTDHPTLGAIHGEGHWIENGEWEKEHPALALCGKAGYFMDAEEAKELSTCKALHLNLSAFPQNSGIDLNPRNDQHLAYHQENRHTVETFCRLATTEEPRYIFIIANRAHILRRGTHAWQLDTTETPSKDKSWKIVDLLRAVDACGEPVQVRLCRQTPQHGRNVDILNVSASVAYELQPVRVKASSLFLHST